MEEGPTGINICGCARGAQGIAQALRGLIKAVDAAGIPYVVNDIGQDAASSDPADGPGRRVDNPYPVNCLHFNPNQLRRDFYRTYDKSYLADRQNIGFWYWETDKLRPSWLKSGAIYDQLWAGSEFCRNLFEDQLDLPTTVVPPVVELSDIPDEELPLSIPDDCFVALCCYDYRSCMERKNPGGTIDAFQLAFPGQRDVLLIMKALGGQSNRRIARMHRKIRRKADGHWPFSAADRRIVFLEDFLSAGQMRGLLNRCDCLVSLHRAEGFGLHLAEAMYLERPVIGTAYSGNMDFMDEDNSYLVGYELRRIRQRSLPYPAGSRWAEPDIGHAAQLLRRVYSHREEAQQKAKRAAERIRSNHSTERVGEIVRLALSGDSSHRPAGSDGGQQELPPPLSHGRSSFFSTAAKSRSA